MRIQVRIGEQYSEIREHLESFRPEVRGKRLLALAAMQLASQGVPSSSTKVPLFTIDEPPVNDVPAAAPAVETPAKKRPAPIWITSNAAG